MKYIKKINNNGTTVCLTTHYLEEAENLCNYITILNRGKIIANETKEKIINIISSKKVTFYLKNFEKFNEKFDSFKYEFKSNVLEIEYDKNKINLNEIINILNKKKIEFTEINTSESNLEDAFLQLTNSQIE